MVVVLVAGLYLATDRWSLGDPWISATFAILFVLFGLVGAVFTPLEKRCLRARRTRCARGRAAERRVRARGAQIPAVRRLAYVLIIVAIFLMTAKPGV